MSSDDLSNLTPAMKQFWKIKKQFPDCLLLFRMGDFYETFDEDAKKVARILQIVLTSRGKGLKKTSLAGIPYHALEAYLHRLIKAGEKVAIIEQLEDPKQAKGLVKRGVVRIVTPGTVMEDTMLEVKSNNYIMSFYGDKEVGITACDFSTGEFYVTKVKPEEVWDEIERFSAKEIILRESQRGSKLEQQIRKMDIAVNFISDAHYWFDNAQTIMLEHFKVYSLDALGVKDKLIIASSGALLKYFYETQFQNIGHIKKVNWYDPYQRMIIDATTLRNLEIIKNLADSGTRNTLVSIVDKTVTPMGSRKLKSWLTSPMINKKEIDKRLETVNYFVNNYSLRENLNDILNNVYDIQRIATRIGMRKVNPKELLSLRTSLENVPRIKHLLNENLKKENQDNAIIQEICEMKELEDIKKLIENSIRNDPPTLLRDGGFIKKGFSQELDEMKGIIEHSRKWLNKLEQQEIEKTGIKTLRISYNKIVGYYIQIPKSQSTNVPINYIRKSTQKNSERFITPELKEKEAIVLTAKEQMIGKEIELYNQIIETINKKLIEIQEIANTIGKLDALLSFAKVACENNYCKPEFTDHDVIKIEGGRHPVVEKMVDSFIPNNVTFDNRSIMIITGPNMSGKSTVMRQTALILLMAQAGCFVPADSAKLNITDRIFSRVGARDDIARGQSTFMMEMTETANILNNASDRSFVVMDEIGRGTSTYDGMALAWAIIEYLNKINCKTMFATHYHLLNLLSLKYSNIINYNIGVKEENGEIVFLHKLVEGGTDKSYGVHVAKLAGLPKEVIIRSMEIADMLEKSDHIHRNALTNLTLDIIKNDQLEKLENKYSITMEDEKEMERKEKKMSQSHLFIYDEE